MIEFSLELITPATADRYLQANVANRLIRNTRVEKYANDMKSGSWKSGTAEMIKISKTGVILDGQHRLLAVIVSNTPTWFHIAKGLDENVFDVLDTGAARNGSDTFRVKGIKYETIIPAVITKFFFLRYAKKKGEDNHSKVTNAKLLETYYENQRFWQDVAQKTLSWYQDFAKIMTPSLIGGMYAHLHLINENYAVRFMTQLTTGIGIENDVITLLRNKLIQDKISPRKMPQSLKIALIIKAWNVFVNKGSLKILKFDTMRDDFPIAEDVKAKQTQLI